MILLDHKTNLMADTAPFDSRPPLLIQRHLKMSKCDLTFEVIIMFIKCYEEQLKV